MQTQSKPVDIAPVDPPKKRRLVLPPLGLLVVLDDFTDEFQDLARGMRDWGWTVFAFGAITGSLVTLCITLLIR